MLSSYQYYQKVRATEWLALPTSDHEVLGSNPAGGVILLMTVRRVIAQSFIITPLKSQHVLNNVEIFIFINIIILSPHHENTPI